MTSKNNGSIRHGNGTKGSAAGFEEMRLKSENIGKQGEAKYSQDDNQ